MLRNIIPPETNFSLSLYDVNNELHTYSFTYKGKTTDVFTRYRFDVTDINDVNKKYQAYVLTVEKELPEYRITSNHAKPNTLMFINFVCPDNAKLTLEGNGNAVYYVIKQRTKKISGTYIETTFDIAKPNQNQQRVSQKPHREEFLAVTKSPKRKSALDSGSQQKRIKGETKEEIDVAPMQQETSQPMQVETTQPMQQETSKSKQIETSQPVPDFASLRKLYEQNKKKQVITDQVTTNQVTTDQVINSQNNDSYKIIENVDLNSFYSAHKLLEYLFSRIERHNKPLDDDEILKIFNTYQEYAKLKQLPLKFNVIHQTIYEINNKKSSIFSFNRDYILKYFDLINYFLRNSITNSSEERIKTISILINHIAYSDVNLPLDCTELQSILIKLFLRDEFLSADGRTAQNILNGLSFILKNPEYDFFLHAIDRQLLTKFIITCIEKKTHTEGYIAVYRAIGRLADSDGRSLLLDLKPAHFRELTDKSLSSISQIRDKSTFAHPLWTIGNLCDNDTTRYLIANISSELIEDLLIDYNYDHHEYNTTVLTALSQLSEHEDSVRLLEKIKPAYITKLLDIGKDIDGITWDKVGQALWCMSKLASNDKSREIIAQLKPDTITKLVRYSVKRVNDVSRCINILHGITKLLSYDVTQHLVLDVNANDIFNLFESAVKSPTKLARHYAVFMFYINKLIEDGTYEHLASKITPEQFQDLLEKATNGEQLSNFQFSKIFTVLGRLAYRKQFNNLLSMVKPEHIRKLFDMFLEASEIESITLFNSIWMLGLLTEINNDLVKLIKPDDVKYIIEKFLQSKHEDAKSFAVMLTAIARLSASPNLLSSLSRDHYRKLIDNYFISTKPSYHISYNMIITLCALITHPYTENIIELFTPEEFYKILSEIPSSNEFNTVKAKSFFLMVFLIKRPMGEAILSQITPDLCVKLFPEYGLYHSRSLSQLLISLAILLDFPHGERIVSKIRFSLAGLKSLNVNDYHTLLKKLSMAEALAKLIDKKIIYDIDKISPNLVAQFKKLLQSFIQRKLDFNLCMRTINIIKTYRLANILTDGDINGFNQTLLKQLKAYQPERRLEILRLIAPDQITSLSDQPKIEPTKSSEQTILNIEKMETEPELPQPTVAPEESKLKKAVKAALPILGNPENGLLISKASWPLAIQSLHKTISKLDVPKIDIDNKKELTKLAQENSYQYDFKTNKKYQPNLSLASVSCIKGETGVFANEPIPKDEIKPIGIYIGSEEVEPESRYALDLEDMEGNYARTVDALHHRDWTAFINHSSTPNLILRPKHEKGKLVAAFYAIKDIKPGDQLTFDYGNDYFNQLGFKPYYLHRTDGPLTHPQIFVRDIGFYDKQLYKFDVATNAKFQLAPNLDWLLPASFKYIAQNKSKELDEFLSKEKQSVDALALGVKEDKILDEQIHMTPLMYACYKGNIECIKVLLAHGAEPDRPLITTGVTPLTLLLTGLGKGKEIEQLAINMFEQSHWPFVQDSFGLNILHYAVKYNYKLLLKAIITRAHKEGVDLLSQLVEQDVDTVSVEPVADMDYCLLNNQFSTFAMLLKSSVFNRSPQFGGKFIDYCKDGSVLKDETLSQLDDDALVELEELLSANDYKKYDEPPILLARVEQEIKKRKSVVKISKAKSTTEDVDKPKKGVLTKQSTAMFKKPNVGKQEKGLQGGQNVKKP